MMRSKTLLRPALGVLVAIAITATMDANGLTVFSALPLLPLMALFWYLERLPRVSVGFVWGRARDYGLAVIYPLVVLGVATVVSVVAGAAHVAATNWEKAALNVGLITIATTLVVMVTEEGFFRGWLWASLERAGQDWIRVLMFSSVAFALWHLSWVTLAKGYTLPPEQIAIFITNAALIGAIWGLLRLISGSVIVASVSHGLWNGGAYVLFGVGTKLGALGIVAGQSVIYGPEVGVVGLVLNLAFAAGLLVWWRTRSSRVTA
jgi:CAAX protease family protein